MDEYIDRSVAIARLTYLEVTDANATMADAKRVLADIPAADVAPVVHGRWLCADDFVICLQCEAEMNQKNSLGVDNFKNYCPNCGAKMDGGTESG